MFDEGLVAQAVSILGTPRRTTSPSSFILHAPLELLARSALLPRIAESARPEARQRIIELTQKYSMEEPVQPTPTGKLFDDPETATLHAIEAGDPDLADAALVQWLGIASPGLLRERLFDSIVARTGAAFHAPILLAELPRAAYLAGVAHLLRGPIRTLAAAPSAQLTWHRTLPRPSRGDDPRRSEAAESALGARLATITRQGPPPRSVVAWMRAVEDTGKAHDVLSDIVPHVRIPEAERTLLRVAAHSMLQDDRSEAPYGWTHCLTLPLAVLSNRDVSKSPETCIAVAATQVVAMRAAMGTVPLDLDWVPARRMFSPNEITSGVWLREDPRECAAHAWHASLEDRSELMTALASFASTESDAHLVKYVLACFDAVARDPTASHLYLSAASYLAAWWRSQPR